MQSQVVCYSGESPNTKSFHFTCTNQSGNQPLHRKAKIKQRISEIKKTPIFSKIYDIENKI